MLLHLCWDFCLTSSCTVHTVAQSALHGQNKNQREMMREDSQKGGKGEKADPCLSFWLLGEEQHLPLPPPWQCDELLAVLGNGKCLWRCVGKQEVTFGNGGPFVCSASLCKQPVPSTSRNRNRSAAQGTDLAATRKKRAMSTAQLPAGHAATREGCSLHCNLYRLFCTITPRPVLLPDPKWDPCFPLRAPRQVWGYGLTLFRPSTNSTQVSMLSMGFTASCCDTSFQSLHSGMRSR